MELEELREAWRRHEAQSLAVNRVVLRQLALRGAERALRWSAAWQLAGLAPALAVVMWLGDFVYEHWDRPEFAFPSLVLDLYALALPAAAVWGAVMRLSVDYSGRVGDVQRRVAELRQTEMRLTRALLYPAVLFWPPLAIVAAKGVLGWDLYAAFGWTWIAVNLAVGVAAIPLLHWAAVNVARRAEAAPGFWREVMRDAAGQNFRRAEEVLTEFAEGERGGDD